MNQNLILSEGELALTNVPMPLATETYAPVSHEMLIRLVRAEAEHRNMPIARSHVRAQRDGQRATINYIFGDPKVGDVGMSIRIINSYDKSRAASVVTGSGVYVCSNGMMAKSFGAFMRRKHTGNVVEDLRDMVKDAFQLGWEEHLENLEMAERFKMKPLTRTEMAELAGRMFVEEKLFTPQLFTVFTNEIDKPSFVYGTDNRTAWDLYNHATHAIKRHPVNTIDIAHANVTAFFEEKVLV